MAHWPDAPENPQSSWADVEPESGATIDYSRDLRHIATLPALEELTFSYTYLESIKFVDTGIEAIAALAPTLRLLSLENTQVRGRHLAPFTNLEALDLVYCPVDDEGLKQIQGLTKLRKLLLRDAVISDDGLKNLRELVNVEQLDLGGTKISDAGLAHLRGMTKLKKLSLQGAGAHRRRAGIPGGNARSGRAQSVWHQNHQCRHRDVEEFAAAAGDRPALHARLPVPALIGCWPLFRNAA